MVKNHKTNIFGVEIDKLCKPQLMDKIENSIKNCNQIKIFTPNTEMISKSNRNKNLQLLLNSADILIADGIGVVIASRIIGDPLPSRLAGIEIGEEIMELSRRNGYKIFILGSKNEVLNKAKTNLENKYKSLKICGLNNGYFNMDTSQNDEVIKKINCSKADILFVCMGFPRQEEWITKNLQKLQGVKVAIGLGGSVDVWGEKVKRAPKLFRKLYLEWLWRISNEPRRAKFLVTIPYFIVNVLKEQRTKSNFNGKNVHIKHFFYKK